MENGTTRRFGVGRALRAAALVLVILLVLPYLLVVFYTPAFVRPISTLMLTELFSGRAYDRQWVAFEDINPVLVQSVMMSEDGQFCTHSGVDWAALNTVIDDALAGEATRGASTIPMQVAKNLFLFSHRSFVRKALEVPIALWADLVWSKRRMMEIYLNIAEWAPGVFGFEATAAIRKAEEESGADPTIIIAVTAHSLQGDEDRCLAAGMDDYMSKPISVEKLETMIRRWLPGTPGEATHAA